MTFNKVIFIIFEQILLIILCHIITYTLHIIFSYFPSDMYSAGNCRLLMCVCVCIYLSLWVCGVLSIRTHSVFIALETSFSLCELLPPSHSCNNDCSKAFWEHIPTAAALCSSYDREATEYCIFLKKAKFRLKSLATGLYSELDY